MAWQAGAWSGGFCLGSAWSKKGPFFPVGASANGVSSTGLSATAWGCWQCFLGFSDCGVACTSACVVSRSVCFGVVTSVVCPFCASTFSTSVCFGVVCPVCTSPFSCCEVSHARGGLGAAVRLLSSCCRLCLSRGVRSDGFLQSMGSFPFAGCRQLAGCLMLVDCLRFVGCLHSVGCRQLVGCVHSECQALFS